MTNEERLATFAEEISYIQDPIIRSFVCQCLTKVPEYFFHIPASSSGKYHPSYALGEGGLVRHTKAAVKIYQDFAGCDAPLWYNKDYSVEYLNAFRFNDAAIAALILHDTFKWGVIDTDEPFPENGHTVHEHPVFAAKFVTDQYEAVMDQLDKDTVVTLASIAQAIASHMGKWTVSKYSTTILPAPQDWLGRIVHMCDLLASRKHIEVQLS